MDLRSTLVALALLVALVALSSAASAQEATVTESADGPVVGIINPTQPTFANNALFNPPGYLQVEASYLPQFFEGPTSTLHALSLLTLLGVSDMVEARIGWNVFNAAGENSGIGDLGVGVRGGFLGGWDAETSLAAVLDMTLPTGVDPFSLGTGIKLFGGLVATQVAGSLQFDLQATVDTHVFTDDPTLHLPVALGVTWSMLEQLRVYGDGVLSLDLTNLTESSTSVLAGVGYFIIPELSIDAAARIGLSERLPDALLTAGVTWLTGRLF